MVSPLSEELVLSAVWEASEEAAVEEEELLEEEPEEEPLSEAQELIETIIAAIRQIDANFFIVITFPFMRPHTAFSFFLLCWYAFYTGFHYGAE